MQIAFGRVRRKTEPTGPGVKIRSKNGQLNDPVRFRSDCGFALNVLAESAVILWSIGDLTAVCGGCHKRIHGK